MLAQHGPLKQQSSKNRQSLPPSRELVLAYLHSVTRTLVRETLTADAGGLVQQRIEFSVPGPGLPTEALPGERFERLPDHFVYDHMQRRIGVLTMRVDPAQAQTLQAGGSASRLAAVAEVVLIDAPQRPAAPAARAPSASRTPNASASSVANAAPKVTPAQA